MTAYILYNGPIYTLDPALGRVQALGVRDGRVVAAGSEGRVQATLGGKAEPINLAGRAVIPALTDAHVHLVWYALTRREVALHDAADVGAAVQRVAAVAARLPAGAWVQGRGWDQHRWGGRWPTAADLDAHIPNHPVLLMRTDGHSAWVNSRALHLAGIDDRTPDPPGGTIQRDGRHATGVLLEQAIELVRPHVPPAADAERLAAVREVIREAHRYGMVGMHIPTAMNAGDGALNLRLLQVLRAAGELTLRCLVYIGLDALDDALRVGLRSGFGDRWVRIGGVKLFVDGTLGSETAQMLMPYEGRTHRGTPTLSNADLHDAVRRAKAGGLAICAHAIGDAANRRVLTAIEQARQGLEIGDWKLRTGQVQPPVSNRQSPIPDRIEHCQILDPHDIPRFAQLGVVASLQPTHCTTDMEVAERLWGARCAGAYAWRALRAAGAVLALGSDAPIEPLNPWLGIHAAVTRQRADGTPPAGWRAEQCLTVAEALHGFTAGAAFAAGAAHEQGTLAPGMLADLAVLSADPFAVAPSELHRIRAELTMLEGAVVWHAGQAAA